MFYSCTQRENLIIEEDLHQNADSNLSIDQFGVAGTQDSSPNYSKIYPLDRQIHGDPQVQTETIHESTAPVQQYTEVSGNGWKQTFVDEFDSTAVAVAKGADPKCFSKVPHCMINWWGRIECPEYATKLKDLNKCIWDVYDYYNYMDFGLPEGGGVNAFHPSQVEVKDGKLFLYATKKPFGTGKNCKKPFHDPRIDHENYTVDCPIISGGVESKQAFDWEKKLVKPGMIQKYGRFEVSAKLNHGPGSWPALWLLAQDLLEENGKKCGWPFNGEIDLMESWTDTPEKTQSGIYSGNCTTEERFSKGFHWKGTSKYYPGRSQQELDDMFWKEFHTYIVEWDQNKIRFLIDNIYIGQFNQGDQFRLHKWPYNKITAVLPQLAMYWILNISIYKPKQTHLDPTMTPFPTQNMQIDYVKVYRKCEAGDSSCVTFNYQNLGALCPSIREYLGDHQGKSMCKAFPHFPISLAKCNEKGGVSVDGKCLISEGNRWWVSRDIDRQCPWPREHVGSFNNKPVCKAFPHFSISNSNCGNNQKWDNYCLWDENGWFRARKIR
jgi:hypothetical protein